MIPRKIGQVLVLGAALLVTPATAATSRQALRQPAPQRDDKPAAVHAARAVARATRDDAPPPAPPPATPAEKPWWQVLEERFLRRCDNPWADDPPDGKK